MRYALVFLRGALLLPLLMTGCSTKPRVVPIDEVDEPVFHASNYMSVGFGPGVAVNPSPPPGLKPNPIIYVLPDFTFERNVSAWAGYSYLPVFWNLLLSGDQYSDSTHLAVGKPAVALHGGISGLAYSQRDGWVTSGLLSVDGKILLNEDQYLRLQLTSNCYDVSRIDEGGDEVTAIYGEQLSERNSWHLDYDLTRYRLPVFRRVQGRFGTDYRNGDSNSDLTLVHSFYLKRKHIFRLEFGFGTRQPVPFNVDYFKTGFQYRFVFN